MRIKAVPFLLLLTFFSLQGLGQGFMRQITDGEMYAVSRAQPLADGQLFLQLMNWHTGAGANHYSTYYALYDEATDQLLYHDMAYREGNDYGHIIQKNGSKQQYLVSHASFGSVTFKYLDLWASVKYPGMVAQHGLMGPPFLWLNDSVFFLRSMYDPFINRAIRFREGGNTLNDTLILAYCDFANNQLVDLDTFRFPFSPALNSYFTYNQNEQHFELIHDSLRATFQRGERDIINFQEHKDWFWQTAKQEFPDDSWALNKRMKELRLAGGIYREVADTLGLLKLTWIEGPNGPIKLRPYYIPANLESSYWERKGFYQSDSIYNYFCLDTDSTHYILARFENGKERYRRRFPYNIPNTYQLWHLSSRADGTFYLSGRRNYERPWGWDSWAEAYLIRLDKNGYVEGLQAGEPFALHWEPEANRLKIFYNDGFAALRYRIVDASGRQMQAGDFLAYEGIHLGDWRSGVYYLQLWTREEVFIGEESFLMN